MCKFIKLSLCISLIFILSCDDLEKAKLIKGKWTCIEWNVNHQENLNSNLKVGFQFKDDKTYEYRNSTLVESGTYKIEGGNLFTTAENELEIAVEIEKLNSDTLIFNMSRSGTPETMVLVRNK